MSKTLTVVIPVYNTDKELLKRCLKSIPKDERISVYVYDDFSNYDVASCVKSIIDSEGLDWLYDDRHKVCQLIHNIGLGGVRNKAIDEVETDYIYFLDSDDTMTESVLTDLKSLDNEIGRVIASIGDIKLIDGVNEYIENLDKYLNQDMIPYFVTPIIYEVRFLRDRMIYFDESRRVFEDIMFSVKFWTEIQDIDDNICRLSKSLDVYYNYYLDNPSLTRVTKEKYMKLHDDLMYWVEWIKEYYKSSVSNVVKLSSKPLLFNRIRYETIKAMEFMMKYNGDLDKYSVYLDNLKAYKIDKILID